MELKGIDIHVHPRTELTMSYGGARRAQMAAYFGSKQEVVPWEVMADRYREHQMMACLMNSTDEWSSGNPSVPNDHLAEAQRLFPDVLMAFGVVEPWFGKKAVEEVKRCHEELGMKGIGEINPGRQMLHANDKMFYPVWEECAKRNLPVLFHTGMMGAGAEHPGGSGFKLQYTRPIPDLDDIAADFPELKIIGAHPSWPWQDEALAVCRHKSNYYIDLSGWAPKYFPPQFVQYPGSNPARSRALWDGFAFDPA